MSRRAIGMAMAAALVAAPAAAQLVPEGIHSYVEGPVSMCGLEGRDIADFVARLRASPAWRAEPIDSDRFELYVAVEGLGQIVFTRPSEPAHPAVTCRHGYEDEAGRLVVQRDMRCDAGRLACDRLFLEFRELDARVRREAEGGDTRF